MRPNTNFKPRFKKEEPYKINERIQAATVRIVGEGIESKVCNIHEALKIAKEKEAAQKQAEQVAKQQAAEKAEADAEAKRQAELATAKKEVKTEPKQEVKTAANDDSRFCN